LPGVADEGQPCFRITQVHFSDAFRGVAASDECLWQTRDGGQRWQMIPMYGPGCKDVSTAPEARIRFVYLSDHSHGWISLDDGSLYGTTAKTGKWCQIAEPRTIHSQYSEAPSFITSMAFVTSSTGWAVEASGALLETTDGGATWVRKRPGFRVSQVLIVDGQVRITAADALHYLEEEL
jgi:photosystem II stability/assembly factor-like uncharacterized protein